MEYCYFNQSYDYNNVDLQKYSRIYIGEELCDKNFIFMSSKIEELIEQFCNTSNISIVLPVINEDMLYPATQFIDYINKKYNNTFELICNDIGIMKYYSGKGNKVVSGRLLTRVIIQYLVGKSDELNLKGNISSVELDSTNFMKMRSIKNYKMSYYNGYSIYGHSNNRCSFRVKDCNDHLQCLHKCNHKMYEISNKYIHDKYLLLRNAILKEENLNKGIVLMNRIIDTFY